MDQTHVMLTAMVLCAGFGTRLRPLTCELPKPLVPLGDRPLLAHIVERLAARGVRRVVLNVHHRADIFHLHTRQLAIEPHIVVEERIRGTAGGIAGARSMLGTGPVIVHTGDILTQPPVEQLMERVDTGLCLAVNRRAIGEGPVGLDKAGHVVRLRGQRFGHESAGAEYIGVCAVGPRCLATLPDLGCLIGDWALSELAAGRAVSSVSVDHGFEDAGDVHAYLQANLAWLAGRNHWLGAGAELASGVDLDQSIVGGGAIVTGEGCLRQCVVWPGAQARAPLFRRVVTERGQVVPVS